MVAATVLAACGITTAAEAAPLTFGEVVREALEKGPEAAKIDATLADRAAEAFERGVKENPVLSAGMEQPLNPPGGEREETELSVSIAQAIRPSDFGARAALAALMRDTAETEKVLALSEFVQALAVLYGRAWQQQEAGRVLIDARTRAAQALKKAAGAANQGLIPEGDVALLKAELKSIEAESRAVRADGARAAAELTRASGLSLSGRELAAPPAEAVPTKDELLGLVRGGRLPIQQRFGLMKRVAEKQLEVSRLDAYPALSPSVGYARHDDGTSQVTLGFSVPLPLFNRNDGERLRAQGAIALANRNAAYASSEAIESEALLLLDALTSLAEQVALYESEVVPARRRAAEAYYRQFEAGSGSIFQFWQAQRDLSDSRLKAIELRGVLVTTKAQMNALTGQQAF
ncbi:MAG: TolC family protein [Gemmataceae bacterium]